MELLIDTLKHALLITSFVFCMMLFVDFLNVLVKDKLSLFFRKNRLTQYFLASFLGATPGCLGAFLGVSMYLRGLLTFGAIVGAMVATSGDEAFVMLALFPAKALFLFSILFVLGIIIAWLSDKFIHILKIKTSDRCCHEEYHGEDHKYNFGLTEIGQVWKKISFARFLLIIVLITLIVFLFINFLGHEHIEHGHEWDWKQIVLGFLLIGSLAIISVVPDHYLNEHIWEHIFKKHVWKIFLWTFFALLITNYILDHTAFHETVSNNLFTVLLIAGLFGLIPQSGPNLIFITLFAQGTIPFSILLANSIVQDGHGTLPLLAHSVKDTILIKLIKFVVGLVLGLGLLALGL